MAKTHASQYTFSTLKPDEVYIYISVNSATTGSDRGLLPVGTEPPTGQVVTLFSVGFYR